MMEYPKIETLLNRDPKTHGVIEYEWRLPEFEYLAMLDWRWTEKINGTNIRVIWDGNELRFGGRTDKAQIQTSLAKHLQDTFVIDQFKRVFPDGDTILFGEGYGAGIQKGGGNYRADQGFILFDVLCGGWWLEWHNVVDVAGQFDIPVVPEIGIGPLERAIAVVEYGLASHLGAFPAEGLVVKPKVGLRTRRGERLVGKIKREDFK